MHLAPVTSWRRQQDLDKQQKTKMEQNSQECLQTSTMVFPYFMGSPWVPKFAGGKDYGVSSCGNWVHNIRSILCMQPLQKQDILIGSLEGEARRVILVQPNGEHKTEEYSFAKLK